MSLDQVLYYLQTETIHSALPSIPLTLTVPISFFFHLPKIIGNPTSVGECNAISTYWVENPNNDLIGNVAAGSIQVGFWYILPYRPTGPSEQAV